jgi:hypothetical protein
MRVRSLFVTIAMAVAALGLWGAPAGAVGVGVFAGGDIQVANDLSACASVTFAASTTFVGAFTATGQVSGPGTKVATIRGVQPFVVTRGTSWSGCIPGAYEGATAGWAKYTLTASGVSGGEVAYVVQCAVTNGVVRCV